MSLVLVRVIDDELEDSVDTFIEVAFQFKRDGDKPASELADLIVASSPSV